MPTVVAGQFEDLVAVGLAVTVGEDPHLDLVARDVPVDELRAALERHAPDIVLVNHDALNGAGELERLHSACPHTRIVVLATRPSASDCRQLLASGASACLSKETQARDVVSAIHLASRGMQVLPRSATAGGGSSRLDAAGAELTSREVDVLELLQDGHTNSEIARQLSIGIETVRTHARSIYRKLGVTSRRELTLRARREPVVVDGERRPVPVPG